MKVKALPVLLMLAVLLTGCSVFEGQYHRVTPHVLQSNQKEQEAYSARNYSQLCIILGNLVSSGTESSIIYLDGFEGDNPGRDLERAAAVVCSADPIGAYAAYTIEFEVGANNGRNAAAVTIQYRRTIDEIQRLSKVEDMDAAKESILEALGNCDSRIALFIQDYRVSDFTQIVRDLSASNPQIVMEIPKVDENVYGKGNSRVVELTFTYETSRDAMRRMQLQVRPIFDSAVLYVSGDDSDNQKFSQLYGFLMERFEYSVETSITPAYSLLRHGVGDSRAFATVYAAMCSKAGLDCRIVTGTRMGEPWIWNIVCDNGLYYHVDLLRCKEERGVFQEKTDMEMSGYVWDFSAYPVCSGENASVGQEKEFSDESEKKS